MRPPDPEKREKILSAAMEVFVENGYHETTTMAISQRAQMAGSHIYTYFKDKEDLLVQAILRMKEEHMAMSAGLAKQSAGLDAERFIALFYEAQEKICPRVRFAMHCMLTPSLAALFEGIDLNYSEVFLPYLKGWPEEQAKHTARALASISVSYFLLGDIDNAKAASLYIFRNAESKIKERNSNA